MFKYIKLSGEYPILIFDFLTKLVEEADTLDISEGQLMVLLPHLLTGSVTDQYRAAANESRSSTIGGIVHWLQDVQHLLRTYVTKREITEALDEFNNVHQTDNENWTAYAARLNNAAYRCGNIHVEDCKI